MFSGGYEHSVDEKGRVIIPAVFREELGKNFVITRGMGACLWVMTEEYWIEQFDNVFKRLPLLHQGNIKLQRHFSAGASMSMNIDTQGRVAIPSILRDYVSIKPDSQAMVLGVSTRLEIWNKDIWVSESSKVSEAELALAAEQVGLVGPITGYLNA